MSQAIKVQTQTGSVVGLLRGGVEIFRGVPYAAPPVGPLRFLDAQPLASWEGIRDVTKDGPVCPQVPARLAAIMGPFSAPQDEDCLTLTISAPAGREEQCPVLVFLHGGGYASGAGSIPWYDGERIAREAGIVVVTVNYRLGALGYLHHPNVAVGNMGLSDQVEAMRWIGRNIAAFGGDPDRVTVMGQSGGAHSILCMLAMEPTRPLVQRAVLLSTPFGMGTIPAEVACANATTLMAELGIDADAKDAADRLRALPARAIVDAQLSVMKRPLRPAGDPTPPFGPVAAGGLQPSAGFRAEAFAAAAKIRILAGTTRDEMSIFYRQDPRVANANSDEIDAIARVLFGENCVARLTDSAKQLPSEADRLTAFCHAQNCAYFIDDTRALAATVTASGGKAWVYQFDWHPPRSMMRACHCIELPFFFGTFDAFGEAPMLSGGDHRTMTALSGKLRKALSHFVNDGDPNSEDLPTWPAYSLERRAVLHIDEGMRVETVRAGA